MPRVCAKYVLKLKQIVSSIPKTNSKNFFFNDTATTEIYTLSLHDALPICVIEMSAWPSISLTTLGCTPRARDRKSTRLNSSHANISYAVFCLKNQQK